MTAEVTYVHVLYKCRCVCVQFISWNIHKKKYQQSRGRREEGRGYGIGRVETRLRIWEHWRHLERRREKIDKKREKKVEVKKRKKGNEMKSERKKYPGSDTWTERTLSLPKYFFLSHYLFLPLCLIFAHFSIILVVFFPLFSCCDMCGPDWKRGEKERQREKNDATKSMKDQRVGEGWASKRRFNDETWRNVVFFSQWKDLSFSLIIESELLSQYHLPSKSGIPLDTLAFLSPLPAHIYLLPFIHSPSDSKNCESGSCRWNYSVLW